MRLSSMLGVVGSSVLRRGAVAAIGVVLVAAGPALGQFGRGGARDFGRPGVTTEEIERIGEILDFSEDQAMVAEQLQAAYMSEIELLGKDFQVVMEGARDEFRESRDPTVWRDLGDVMQKFQAQKDAMTESLLSDVRLVLTPTQDERWVEVERFHRRFGTLGNDGLISGEGVDLIEAVKTLELDEGARATADATLAQYAIDLDRALIERNKAYENGLNRGRALFFGGDPSEIEKLFDEAKASAIRLRDVNRRYARQLVTALDAESASELQREIEKRSFPRVYRESYADRAFATVKDMSSLTGEQRERLETVVSSYQRELDAANKRMAEAIEKEELARTAESMMPRRGRGGGRNESDELREAREAKQDLAERWVSRLREVLTDEQRSQLPERPGGADDWRDRGRIDG